MDLNLIKTLLANITQFEIKEIIDNSHHHSNHPGVQNLDYPMTHIQINIINKNKLKRLEIHIAIYQKLNLVIEKGLHSIEIKILNA